MSRQEMIDLLVRNVRLGMFHEGYDQCQIEERCLVTREMLEDKSDLELKNLVMINC